MKLVTRVALSHLSLVLLMALMGVGLTALQVRALHDTQRDGEIADAGQIADRIDRSVALSLAELSAHSQNDALRAALLPRDGSLAVAPGVALSASAALQNGISAFSDVERAIPRFLALELLSFEGAVLAHVGDAEVSFREQAGWTQAVHEKGSWCGQLTESPGSRSGGLPVAVRVDSSGGAPLGVLRGVLSGESLFRDALAGGEVEADRVVRVLNREMGVLFSTAGFTFGESFTGWVPAEGAARRGGLSAGRVNGQPLYLAFARSGGLGLFGDLGWTVVVLDTREDLRRPVRAAWQRLAVFLVIAFGCGAFIGLLLARSIQRMASARDLSVAESTHRNRLLLSLAEVGREVLEAKSRDGIYAAAGHGARCLGYHSVIWKVEEGLSLTLEYASFEAELLPPAFTCRVVPDGILGTTIDGRRALALPDLGPLWAETLGRVDPSALERLKKRLGPQRAVCIPLVRRGEVRELLMVMGIALTEDDVGALSILAGQVATAIENASLIDELRSIQTGLERRVEERAADVARERNQLRALMDSVPDLIYFKDRECRFVINNRAHLDLLGAASQAEAAGKTDHDFFSRDMAARFAADDLQVMESGVPLLEREEAITDATGARKWVSPVKVPIRDATGRTIGIAGISRDITAHREAEEQIESLARFPGENPNPILRFSMDGTLLYANASSHELLAAWDTRTGGQVPSEQQEWVRRAGAKGGQVQQEYVCGGKTYSISVVPITGTGYANVYGRDVTESRTLEERLLQSQKMEAVGRLAGGIAHDFNNLMTVVLGYSERLLRRLEGDPPAQREAAQIKSAGEKAAALTSQLLSFSRQRAIQKRVIDVERLLRGMEDMIRRLIGEDVHTTVNAEPDTYRIEADPAQLEQVLLNLAINARDAMPDGGRLAIEARNVEFDEAYAAIHVDLAPGRYVQLSVADTGCGMDAQTRARIFEPFYTTKAEGKGTGLGLSIVYGIVKQSAGSIWVYSEPGRGTTFKLYFPQSSGSPPAEATHVQSQRHRQGGETILLAEDEESLRDLMRMGLEEKGYTVLTAGDGEEALELLRSHPAPIHLLVTDMVLPKRSGMSLSREIASIHPEARVLFMSGYTDQTVPEGGIGPGSHFLQKPFGVDALERMVASILVGPGEQGAAESATGARGLR